MHEAFLIHTIRTRESAKGSAQVLELYKDAVRETLANGFVTREEVQLLESLRNQLHIKKADHDKVMAALAEEERAMIDDPSKQISAEKRLQLETYAHALQNYLERVLNTDEAVDARFIMRLRSEYRVTESEHAAVLDELLGGAQGMAARLAEEIRSVERAAKTMQALELARSPTHDFLHDLLRRRRERDRTRGVGGGGGGGGWGGFFFFLVSCRERAVREGCAARTSDSPVVSTTSCHIARPSPTAAHSLRETSIQEPRCRL